MGIITGRNELIPMTRRYPELKQKQLIRDSKIAKRLITAWDTNQSDTEAIKVFESEHKHLSDPRYWELLKTVWIVTGSIQNADLFRKWMSSKRGYKHYFMSPEEKAHFDSLPDKIVCYRACDGDDGGLSYTLDYEYAEKYRDMFGKELIQQRSVCKEDVFAYIDRNAESELIIL